MATFQIFEDLEKENRITAPLKVIGNLINNKDKRPTFGLLNNVANNGRDAGKPSFRDSKLKTFGRNDENVFNPAKSGKIFEPTIQLDQFQGFSVYKDDSSNEIPPPEEEDENVGETSANISISAMRNPFHELKNDFLETPMSISDNMTPMSIDKSMREETPVNIIAELPNTCQNDRDRFFEVEEYRLDILEYLREAETRNRPKFGYMRKQPDINHSMRTILVDWLVEVSEEYRLQSETLCLAVSYIDRFLSFMSVVRAKLQLVGTAAMFIAAKYEEIYPPDVAEFVYITDDTYTKKQVLRMEQLILKVLSFDLSVPTSLVFINVYAIMNDISDKVKWLAMYFCELSLLEADPYLQYTPSHISAAALALARFMLEDCIWTKELEESLNYTLSDLKEVILHLNKSHHGSVDFPQQAIQDKYKNIKYQEVSKIKPCNITEETFAKVQLQEIIISTRKNNEDVRKMISSLIFV